MKKIYKINIGKEEVVGHFTTKVLNYTSNCQQMLGVSHIANEGQITSNSRSASMVGPGDIGDRNWDIHSQADITCSRTAGRIENLETRTRKTG